MCVDERGKCEDVRICKSSANGTFGLFLTYFFMTIVMLLIMKLLYIHMSPLYIHGMAKRKQKKFLLLTLHH